MPIDKKKRRKEKKNHVWENNLIFRISNNSEDYSRYRLELGLHRTVFTHPR
jgi:hypothetical protein